VTGNATDSDSVGTAAAAVFEEQRGRLFGLAYRLLGSASDAEDVLQDAFLRWDAADRDAIRSPAAWLTRAVTNLCLTELASARLRRESYAGIWLPEPVLTGADLGGGGTGAALGPLETVAQRESVSIALLLLCEQLSPAERAAFILHEAFGYGYKEIGELIDRSEAACRQLGHRAATRLKAEPRPARFTPADPAEATRWRQLTAEFLAAAMAGDLAGLERILADDAVAFSDGGGQQPAGLRPVSGRAKVARLYAVLGSALQPGADLTPALAKALGGVPGARLAVTQAEVNGGPAILIWADDQLFALFIPVIDGAKVASVYSVSAPAKLAAAARQARQSRNAAPPSQ